MRSRSQERSSRRTHSHHHHHAPSRSHSAGRHRRVDRSRRSVDDGPEGGARRGLRILVGTANLADAPPDPDSLSAFLPRGGEVRRVVRPLASAVDGGSGVDARGKLEVVAVGLQGIAAEPTGTAIEERSAFGKALGILGKPFDAVHAAASGSAADAVEGDRAELGGTKRLREMIVAHLGEDYALFAEFQRGEVLLYLFVRNDLVPKCKIERLEGENVGAAGCGIAALLSVRDTKLTFLCAHLDAREGNRAGRNSDMAEILRGTDDPTLSAHHSFVFGDLNYRCDLPKSARGAEPSKEEAKVISRKMVEKKDWDKFHQLDELRKALDGKEVLVGFDTPRCTFPPTFKVEKKEGFYYNYQRTPSYTDRILWKSNEETRKIEPIIYEASSKFTTSDHKPVRGLFFLPSRPSLRLDHLDKTVLNIELSHIQCKGLKPSESLLDNDIDTFIRVKCEPSNLLLKSSRSKYQTNTIKTSDRPNWRKDAVIKFQINVESKEYVHGSFLRIESVIENVLTGNSVLGTAVLDLEHIVRKSLGVKERTAFRECDLLRCGKCVGHVSFHLHFSWDGAPVSQHQAGSNTRTRHTVHNEKLDDSSREHRHRGTSDARKCHTDGYSSRPQSSSQGDNISDKNVDRKERHTIYQHSSSSLQDNNFSDGSLSCYLSKLRLPLTLLSEVKKYYYESERRIWAVDNSASMHICDYQSLGDNDEMLDVSRWEELSQCVCFHAKMGARVGMETEFHLLNKPSSHISQSFSVGKHGKRVSDEIEEACRVMKDVNPTTCLSPLVEYIHKFSKSLSSDQIRMLKKNGRFISLVLATQGVPTSSFGKTESDTYRTLEKELYHLNKLPVKLVVRLCTGDEETIRLYNEIDSKLENCDVLRDYQGEATEVYLYNPWLTYSIGLHRLREAGLAWDGMDLLDEETLSFDNIHKFCSYFFGTSHLPHPHDNWDEFIKALSQLNKREEMQYHPIKKKKTPWIDICKLESMLFRKQKRTTSRCTANENTSSQTKLSDDAQSTDDSLEDYLHHWANQPPSYKVMKPLTDLLVAVPDAFPPTNSLVEWHDYFCKWKVISEEAFEGESGEGLDALLKKAIKKVKLFLHPDKLPADLTENQSKLFKEMWNIFMKSEATCLQ